MPLACWLRVLLERQPVPGPSRQPLGSLLGGMAARRLRPLQDIPIMKLILQGLWFFFRAKRSTKVFQLVIPSSC
jgi:hypothetical protein